ncbi:MAG TPA: DEAD/DEAH box helicase family protein [Aquabacterium sp.]|nr:DEAD/DEAH box helicase family protein [Aquabacterium sp.]
MNLKTLRTFLKLGARAQRDGIPQADVLRQEQTVLAALRRLDKRPGILLADEVGMGKTYEALGIAAAVRRADPDARIVIVTPGPELNAKWAKDIAGFKEMHDFGSAQVRAARHLRDFVEATRTSRIVVAPVTIFRTGRAQEERACILALYCRWKGLPHQTVHAVFRRVFPDRRPVPDLDGTPFLGAFGWEDLEAHLDSAFGCNDGSDRRGTLDAIYTHDGIEGFRNGDAVRRGMYHARFALCAGLLPVIRLLIVDEAHKLRNPGSLQTSAMRQVFEKRFDKALLLTATPFQLDVGELREIFCLFSQATTAPPDLMGEIDDLLSSINIYQERYDLFQQVWTRLDPLQARAFSERYEADGLSASFEDANLVLVLEHVKALHGLKTATIQPRLRDWMIRSLRPEKRDYRQGVPQRVRASGTGVLPFLVYERFIAELFRQNRPTHKVAAEINMVSSYAAVAGSALMTADEALPASAEEYRDLLRKILPAGKVASSGHPKVSAVVADVLAAVRVKEKTLVFCARTETIRQLQNEISHAWEAELVERWRRV